MTQQPHKNRKALGPVTNWTDAKLKEMSLINDTDIQDALKLWNEKAPMPLKNLLRARPKEQASG